MTVWDIMRLSDVIKITSGALRRVNLDVKMPIFRELIRGPNEVGHNMTIYDDLLVATRAALSNGAAVRGSCATRSGLLVPVVTHRPVGTEGGTWTLTCPAH